VYCGGVDAATKATARTAAGPSPCPPAGARIHRRAGLDVLSWPALEQAGLDAIVTTRHGVSFHIPAISLVVSLGFPICGRFT